MKRNSFRLIALVLVAVGFLLACFFGTWTHSTVLVLMTDDLPTPETPSVLNRIAGLALLVAVAGAIGVCFLPFRNGQRELPIFFRAHVFVPLLFAAWILSGAAFPFSPHQLTHDLPDFLLGADDWGVGNIYTFTKLAYWVALFAGCAACGRLAENPVPTLAGVAKRFRLCVPHLIAAGMLPAVGGVLGGACAPLFEDLALLYVWLLVGFFAIVALQAHGDSVRRRWPRLVAWLVAFGWLFVSVARHRP